MRAYIVESVNIDVVRSETLHRNKQQLTVTSSDTIWLHTIEKQRLVSSKVLLR
jgi:hypothetical protein